MRTATDAWQRLRAALRRARAAQRRRDRTRSGIGRVMTAAVCVLAGLMVIASALNARGTDLRPGRNTDLVSLVQSESRQNTLLASQLTMLRADVDELSRESNTDPGLEPQVEQQAALAGLRPVVGPAVSVTLNDAPETVAAVGVDADLLVVHQQDIQAVVNALWSGGAEAMTIQGQRVISTTGIKCVGNTVVLHGIPYAPPYVVSAIGDQQRLQNALANSDYVRIYKQYVDAYGLKYEESSVSRAEFPAHQGTLELQYAGPLTGDETPSKGASAGPR
ncbi:MAG: DUF881 domain-containing protein [Propionibacteriaceae bacterium]